MLRIVVPYWHIKPYLQSNTFRIYLLSFLLLVGIAFSWAVIAQLPTSNVGSADCDGRIIQLERITNAHSRLLTQFQNKIYENQQDIDVLHGQIQESQHQLSQVAERQKQLYQQMDKLSKQFPTSTTENHSTIDKASYGTETPTLNRKDIDADYNTAVALALEKKEYDQAISMFQNFIKRYPDSTYQANANYWLGQLNFNKGKKENAAYYFALVAKHYPKSPKASDALLKVGIIMEEKRQIDKARTIYQEVRKTYPSSDAAKQAQKRLVGL